MRSSTRRDLLGVVTLGLGLMALLTIAATGAFAELPVTPPTSPDLDLDHFKCYFVYQDQRTDLVNEAVFLGDQFASAWARVFVPVRLCNPVKKIPHTTNVPPSDIRYPDAHLKLYLIHPSEQPVTRRVRVRNQFGAQTLKVFDAQVLAVPASKVLEQPTTGVLPPPPVQLDHFKCYRVVGKEINNTFVDLEDQFGLQPGVQVLQPFGLCNPTYKFHPSRPSAPTAGQGTFTPITRPRAHLVCYKIKGEPIETPKPVYTNDQFKAAALDPGDADLLCVPSLKTVLRTTPGTAP